MSAPGPTDVARSRRSGPRLTRRQGLISAALLGPAALLAACSSDEQPTATATLGSETAEPTVDETVAADESLLIAHYDAVLATLPESQTSVREVLHSIREQHVAHREALGGGGEADLAELPEEPSLSSLTAAEKAASKARIRSCVDTTDPELARVLAFICASEASHVPTLKRLT